MLSAIRALVSCHDWLHNGKMREGIVDEDACREQFASHKHSFHEELIVKPTKEKFPHVTLTFVRNAGTNTPENMIAAGFADIVLHTPFLGIPTLKPLGALEPLDSYIKQKNIDLNQFDTAVVESIKTFSDKNEMLAYPFTMFYAANFYNKAVFDRFGVEYPKDSMTWEAAIELGRRLARTDGGINYVGIHMNVSQVPTAFSIPYADPATLSQSSIHRNGHGRCKL